MIAPGTGTGQDFATVTLPSGPWDMEQAADVEALGNVNPAASRLQAAPGGGSELYAESLAAPAAGAPRAGCGTWKVSTVTGSPRTLSEACSGASAAASVT